MSGPLNIGLNAAQACSTISSEAANITAAGNAVAGGINAVEGLFSPANWQSSNTAIQETRNVLGIDMSTNDTQKIISNCGNMFSGVQINSIDTSQCPYCQQHGCSLTNITQESQLKNHQNCIATSLINALRQQTNNVKALAAAQAVQEAAGLLTANKSTSQNCNYVSANMSANAYLEAISECNNQAAMEQKNLINSCGPVQDVLQANSFNNFQECLAKSTGTLKSEVKNEITATSESKVKQEATGLSLPSSTASSFISIFISIFCCCFLIFGLISGGAIWFFGRRNASR
jgi:hypothetical protein